MRCLLSLAILVSLWGCDQTNEIIYVDPAVKVAPGLVITTVQGDPYVELGYYYEQLYDPLTEGGECPVGFGLQGGTWTMPALRTTGIGSPATIECRLRLESGELVGEVTATQQFYLSPDGFLEIAFFPIPVNHAKPDEKEPIDDLYGQNAILWCAVSDSQGRTNESKLDVVIVDG